MTLLQWFIFFLAVQVIHFLGTWKLYQKAGRKPWEAAVPVYNAVVLMKIIRRSPWWTILLFVPIVNLIMFPVVWVETLRSFGKNTTTDTVLGVVTLGFYIYYINYTQELNYLPERDLKPKSKSGDTVSSLLFAVVVATIVHTYVIQPFTIPTASLEKTLLIGDFLFVSKIHYGARTPITTIGAPMVHDSIPVVNVKSYSNWPQLPYFRLPGFEKVKKNDIVVFNWPTDTLVDWTNPNSGLVKKPIDKKMNYVKRCVGIAGDKIEVKNGIVFVNGQELKLSDRARVQYNYTVTKNGEVSAAELEKLGITDLTKSYTLAPGFTNDQLQAIRYYVKGYKQLNDGSLYIITDLNGIPLNLLTEQQIKLTEGGGNSFVANLTFEKADKLKKMAGIASVERVISEPGNGGNVFPGNQPNWSQDNMGPISIPKEGETVQLTKENLPFYKLIIGDYERNDLKVAGNDIIINGKTATSYTFKQNYYWMMGDNRHNSLDSRYFGFVPEDHIVGKPVLIWMSIDQNEKWSNISKKIRWDRMFTTVGGDGEPVSYFKYFVGLLIAYFVFDYFRKKKAVKA
ncbi:signal peptidase I [Flavobacterium sp. Sd200]|uniref:signal peptidase I n=1 Tax=Flavobacterium sp. Sd200 TaxID=2692211 RepID=UPI00136CC8E2|nr:signal peptidase I [Flavobacterium sp. Sd200]MXN92985.1 signal peptidase I [Flavobacterium sp. Sd200]